MKRKLSRIRRTWRRFFITVTVTVLWFMNRLTRSRARFHWVGYRRRIRPERLMMVLLFFIAMLLLEPREYVLWSISAGSGASLFLMLSTVYRLISRRRAHWIR